MSTATEAKPLVDAAEIRRAVGLLYQPGDVFELRALDACTAADKWAHTATGYFDDPDKLVSALRNIRKAKGIYTTVNPADQALLARSANRIRKAGKGEATGDGDIPRRRWLPIDIDAKRPAGISSTDDEHEAAIETMREVDLYLHDLGFPEGIHADSGNGAHLLYRVDLPADDDGLIQRVLGALAARFNDDRVKVDTSVYNPARIWKLYGTLVCKGDDTPDRPHRYAKIISAPDHLDVVPVELLEAIAAEADDADQDARQATHNGGSHQTGKGQAFDVAAFIERHGLDVRGPEPWKGGQLWTFNTSPLCEHHDDGPFIAQLADGAISAKCKHNSCSWTWHDLRAKFEPKTTPQTGSAGPRPAKSAPIVEKFTPFPLDVIPEPLQWFIEIAAKSQLCDPSLIALPCLAVCATAIGNTRRLRIRPGWDVPAIVWTVDVGESGSGKSPAYKRARAPLMRRQERWFQRYNEAMATYEEQLADYADAKRQKTVDPALLFKPEPPACQREITSDATIEALAPILQENPRGLLVGRDELSGWLGSFDRYSAGKGKTSGDSAAWLSMYNADSVIVDRRTNRTTIYVPEAWVCVTGGIQPGILARAMHGEHRESGLLARLLLTAPPRSPKRWTDNGVPAEAEATYEQLIDKLFTLDAASDDSGVSHPVYVTMTPEAKAVWVDHYNAINAELNELHGDLAAAWSKLEEIPARLALILHYIKLANTTDDLNAPSPIDAETMTAAVRLADWFKGETRRVYAMLAETEQDRERRRLAEWIGTKGGRVTIRQMQQGHRHLKTSEDAEAVLRDLVAHGYCTSNTNTHNAGPGRPVEVFTLSTRLQSTE